MSLGKRFRTLNIAAGLMVLSLSAMIAWAMLNQHALNRAQDIRYESYLLANELRQSSDDLTRLARTYVITRDAEYERQYWDILAVRNGEKPRADGRLVSLQKLMENLGFSAEEFGKLKEAENNSNSLVRTETIAMNAIKGLFDDGAGSYTKTSVPDPEMAQRIMHDQKYHADKSIIMQPIKVFEDLLNKRTQQTVDSYAFKGNLLLGVIAIMALGTAALIFFIVRSVKGVLRQVVHQLKDSSVQASASIAELLGTSKELAAVSDSQSSAIQETVATLDEISAMAAKSLENAKSSSNTAHEGHQTAQQVQAEVQHMLKAINDIGTSNAAIVTQVESSNKHLSGIIKIITDIGNRTKVINDIVFQTKLLSFNASVEAARANEHGKGFAVVAEEIGKLAQMSGNAAKEISSMLEGSVTEVESIIKETSGKIGHLVTESRSKIDAGTKVVDRCQESLAKMVTIVDSVSGFMSEVTRASGEQAQGVEEIGKAMRELEEAALRNKSTASTTANLSETLMTSSAEMEQLVQTIQNEVLGQNAAVVQNLKLKPVEEAPLLKDPPRAA